VVTSVGREGDDMEIGGVEVVSLGAGAVEESGAVMGMEVSIGEIEIN
jgi:hypothetical protein